jgi:hypothetical protein
MALTIYNLPSERVKINFAEFDKAIFRYVGKPFESIFQILCIEKKKDFKEVADVMI